MSLPEVVTPEEWRAARVALLAEEKAMTRARDALATKRRQLPMVRVDKDYVFAGPDGEAHLIDLFHGRRQLFLQHFMFDPSWDAGCPSCSADADELSEGLLRHLETRDTSFTAVSRAPIDKIERYRSQRGWTFPWYSSFGSDFNYDFHVTIDASVAPIEFNYRTLPELTEHDMGWVAEGSTEQPGYSVFLRDGNDIFHTYSTFGRGTEAVGGSYYYLDLTPLGRQEEWEEPKGRADTTRANVPDFAT